MALRKIDSMHFNETENLLDLVLPATTADTNIHTFTEFKEWMSNSFHIKTQLNTSSYIKKNELVHSLKLKQARSLSNDPVGDLLGSIKRRPSIGFRRLDEIEEGKEGMQSSYMAESRNRSRNHSNSNIQLGLELVETSILGSKSAHSRKSFNGFEQINQYEFVQKIGKGSFAEVYLGVDTQSETQKKYAIKVLASKQIKKRFLLKKNSQALDSNEKQEEEDANSPTKKVKQSLASMFVKNEVIILKKMNHQYITKLLEVIVDNQTQKIYLVLQFCKNGFINQSKQKKGQYRRLLQSECKRYYKQLSSALDYIHNVAKIAHRDIKPENILLSEFDEVKISDFGLGTHKMKGKKQSGTPLYMSPESLNSDQDTSSQPCDIWALGVTLIVLLSGKHPDFDGNKIDIKKAINGLKDVSDHCKDFIQRCLQVDVKKRIKAEELLSHPWLSGSQNQNMRNSNNPYEISVTAADEQNVFSSKVNRKPNQIKITMS